MPLGFLSPFQYLERTMKLKSLIVAAMMLAFAGANMAQTAKPAKESAHKKAHVMKKHTKAKHQKVKHHKVKHKKAAAAQ
jgi:polyhydroxyalkanoate synthesis regulator protein